METARIISLPGQTGTEPARTVRENLVPENVRIILENLTRRRLEEMLRRAEERGDLREAKRIMAVFAAAEGRSLSDIAPVLNVSERTVCRWFHTFLLKGPDGLRSVKPPGRKSRLTKSQKKELDRIITEGPAAAGLPGACWRSPMIQNLIYEKFGVFYAVHYISKLLKNMGFSWQKAKFVPDRRDEAQRRQWLQKTWPEILKTAEEKNACILFGDESSFPQWGSLSYTWAKKGQQPAVKTSGNRKSYKVFGLIDYFSGRFFSKGHEGKLNSGSYASFLKEVMKKVRKHIILIQDGAPYHKSGAMREFFEKHSRRLTVYRLPAYSPDYNPIEKLWKKIKEKEIHLHYFPTFADLKKKVNEALLNFGDLKNEILSLFLFYDRLPEKNSDPLTINLNVKINIKTA
jgi:transposase